MTTYSKIAGLKAKPFPEKFLLQIKLLLWKRYQESTKSRWELLKVLMPSWLFFTLLILLYEGFGFFAAGGLEPFLVPLAFWVFMQRIVVQIMHEKSSRLQESMRMMGLSDVAYWTGYFLSDGVILGFIMSFTCAIFSSGGLFNNANFGVILGMLLCFCISAVPFAFFLSAFFDTPQTSGQATLAILIGFYVIYIAMFTADNLTIAYKAAQVICCLFPPFALQIGCGSFLKSYNGIPTSEICGIMVADIFIYSLLGWYFSQVWPTKVGVARPWYFVFLRSYWFPNSGQNHACLTDIKVSASDMIEDGNTAGIPAEEVNESLLGAPTVAVNKLKKTYGSTTVVNDLSFNMYENQIFALLGHNGAGKTTTISMLTGMTSPDYNSEGHGAHVYGADILSEMDSVRMSMGVCPQHDVLFEGLSVREHILFFAQLKGASYEAANEEAISLTTMFHLDERMDHLGNELSGGQRRKLSVAIAVCGGSKFVVLDEPTAGMDPLARRELWDLLAALRKGRTMLLTTHYMDEADILGDRVGIMSLGQMQCVGSTQFLKNTYGAGYKLIFDKKPNMTKEQLANLTSFVQSSIPEAKYFEEDGAEDQAFYSLPFSTVNKFGSFFTKLEGGIEALHVSNYGVTITSLEDVFLKVGEDHSVTPTLNKAYGIGADRKYESNMMSQIIGICGRKLIYSMNDFVTIPLVGIPIAAMIAAAILNNLEIISKDRLINDIVVSAIYMGGYLGAPGLIAEFLVKERNDKLRNVLTVMGCDFRAYWIGTFLADFIIMSIPMVVMWITWGAAGMDDFYTGYTSSGAKGVPFLFSILFTIHIITFSYFFSNAFTTPKACISYFPIILIMLLITPNIVIIICFQIATAIGTTIPDSTQGGIYLWGELIVSPHGAFFCGLINSTADYGDLLDSFPPLGACIAIIIAESVLYMLATYYIDVQAVVAITPSAGDPTFDPAVLEGLDEDVKAERERTAAYTEYAPLKVNRLRKVFPPKVAGRRSVVATQDVSFVVERGETFGLLGANGAGKTTTLSMLTRHLVATSGDALVSNHSILSSFRAASTHMGVVTQNNSLWDRLSVEDHLYLFARLRGVPEDLVHNVVDGTIDQLELTPHRHKLSMRLSGGMKRKLCVAIALIGDPELVLLDEPSAGLDPVSRRNLWSVILRTMSHRAVILTTHSMDEAEALCKRIGIMVHGQLRALGTKQHLKNKFGSGFELVVKLIVKDFDRQMSELTAFVVGMFPSAHMISENGGLVTYQIPLAEMKMGLAFTNLQNRKAELGIEDYSIAQPTLEQVFIRTVNKHAETKQVSEANGQVVEEVYQEINKCGCTRPTTQIMTCGNVILFLAFWIVGIFAFGEGGVASIFYLLGIICLLISVLGCSLLCCACCRPPTGADE